MFAFESNANIAVTSNFSTQCSQNFFSQFLADMDNKSAVIVLDEAKYIMRTGACSLNWSVLCRVFTYHTLVSTAKKL